MILVGGGVEVNNLRAAARRRSRLNNVLFLPPIPVTEIGNVLEAADVLLAQLNDVPLFEVTIPGKNRTTYPSANLF